MKIVCSANRQNYFNNDDYYVCNVYACGLALLVGWFLLYI